MYVIIYRITKHSSIRAHNQIYEDRERAIKALPFIKDDHGAVEAWVVYFNDPRK